MEIGFGVSESWLENFWNHGLGFVHELWSLKGIQSTRLSGMRLTGITTDEDHLLGHAWVLHPCDEASAVLLDIHRNANMTASSHLGTSLTINKGPPNIKENICTQ
jgi:hypothetical protein